MKYLEQSILEPKHSCGTTKRPSILKKLNAPSLPNDTQREAAKVSLCTHSLRSEGSQELISQTYTSLYIHTSVQKYFNVQQRELNKKASCVHRMNKNSSFSRVCDFVWQLHTLASLVLNTISKIETTNIASGLLLHSNNGPCAHFSFRLEFGCKLGFGELGDWELEQIRLFGNLLLGH